MPGNESPRLERCSVCHRHIRPAELSCPFCDRSKPKGAVQRKFKPGVRGALGAAVLGMVLGACPPAPVYGGPPANVNEGRPAPNEIPSSRTEGSGQDGSETDTAPSPENAADPEGPDREDSM